MSAPKIAHTCRTNPDTLLCDVCFPNGCEEYCHNTTLELRVKGDDQANAHGYIVRYEYNEDKDWRHQITGAEKYWHTQQLRIPRTHTAPKASLASCWGFVSDSTSRLVVAVDDYIVMGTGYANLGPGNKIVGRSLDLWRVVKATPKKIYVRVTREPFELLALTHNPDGHQVPRFENKKRGYHTTSFFKKEAIDEMCFIKT